MKNSIKANCLLLLYILTTASITCYSQTDDTTITVHHFSAAVGVTNNGISLVPTFSLGKPAVIFNMSVGKKKLSFEPELDFSVEGKPWSFLFWWRYKLLTTNKFRIGVGAHPAINFRTDTIVANGVLKEGIIVRRSLVGELSPNYLLSKNISIGLYYLYARGFDEKAAKNSHFLSVNSVFSNIQLTDKFYMQIIPQLYYLKLDAQDGFYFASTVSLVKKNFPLSLSSIMNKTIHTDILGSKNFVWNVTLTYFINKDYVQLKPRVL